MQGSSVSSLPEEPQSSALRILDQIRLRNLKGIPLAATQLREQVRMDPHRFHPLFRWLLQHGYCRATLTKTSKKFVSITGLGELVLRKRHKLGRLSEIANAIYRAPDPGREMALVQDLILEAFDLAYSEFYYGGKSEDYEVFARGLEERLREHLDKETEHRSKSYPHQIHDVMLVIRTIPLEPLLKDAELAMRKGHFLTQNHRYALNRARHIELRKLSDHNVRWKKRVMATKFSGSESDVQLMDLLDPYRIVELEKRKRATPSSVQPSSIRLARDSFDSSKLWQPDTKRLEARCNEAHKQHENRFRSMKSIRLS